VLESARWRHAIRRSPLLRSRIVAVIPLVVGSLAFFGTDRAGATLTICRDHYYYSNDSVALGGVLQYTFAYGGAMVSGTWDEDTSAGHNNNPSDFYTVVSEYAPSGGTHTVYVGLFNTAGAQTNVYGWVEYMYVCP